jgi:hypothetical protein
MEFLRDELARMVHTLATECIFVETSSWKYDGLAWLDL